MKFPRLIYFILLLLPFATFAQKTQTYENEISEYNRALELFKKEQYGQSQKHFLNYAARTKQRETRINAEYYSGVCAMELFNPDAITLLQNVTLRYPEHSKAKLAQFQLGKYYYRVKDNKSAIACFERVTEQDLTPDDADEYWFLKGYCYFKLEQYENAQNSLKNIKDEQNKYYDASNYYYGYVVYRQGKFDEAMEHFQRAQKSKTFGPLARVYIAQIYFSRKQYKEVISYADTISNKEIVNDVAGMIGQSYYYLGDYAKAIPYLEKFNADPPVSKTSQDVYRLGYAYLRSGNYEKAVEQLSTITGEKDTLSQFANYYLGESYLALKQKQPARLAFDRAYRIGINPEITELSLYNYSKLSFELSYQQEALKELVNFINTYPDSRYIDEARSLLGDLLLSTKNYKDAVTMIESVKNPSEQTKTAYQRVCYYRAEELYLNNDYEGAMTFFKKSLKYDFDKRLYALAHFWIGELEYKQNKYAAAYEEYAAFSDYKEVTNTRFYPLSFYNKGYSKLKLEEYSNAISEFKKLTELQGPRENPELYTDATMRIADCYFVLREYDHALDYYDMIIINKLNGSDYALYQKAMILGVQNNFPEKVAALQHIIDNYPRSPYIDDALYELANVNLQREWYADAVKGFQNIIDNYPRSPYIRKAMLNKGLSYYNQGKDQEALQSFKTLITNYSSSDEAKEALVVVKNIYVSKGESDEYLEFIKVLPNVVLSPSYQDSVTYESAFTSYKNGDCTKASKGFSNYINRFPGGYFILKANYYRSECDFKLKNYDSALVSYEYVAIHNRSDFTERAVRQSAVLYFMKKNYEKAFEYYSSLERIGSTRDNLSVALLGQMKSASLTNKIDTAAQVSFRYINSTIAQKEGIIEARFNIGRYYLARNQPDSALTEFQYVVKETKSVMAAESKYDIAYIRFLKKDYKQAKKTILEMPDNYSSYDYWVAKAFLLLADIYLAEKDTFQAKATLQSLIENYEGEDIKQVASDKLKLIIDEEERKKEEQNAPKPEKEIEKL